MNGSIIHSLPRYDRFLGGKGSIDIGYPWLTVGAILALEKVVFRGYLPTDPQPRTVLEFGSGGSTIFFARLAEHVRSYESDPEWTERMLVALKAHGVDEKVRLECHTTAGLSEAVSALPDNSFDILLVDHAADPTITGRAQRRAFNRLPHALVGLRKLKPDGWLVVDNYATHGMQNFDYTGWDVWLFDDMQYSGRGTLIARRMMARRALR